MRGRDVAADGRAGVSGCRRNHPHDDVRGEPGSALGAWRAAWPADRSAVGNSRRASQARQRTPPREADLERTRACCGPEELASLGSLGDALARTTGGRVLTVVAGSGASTAGAVVTSAMSDVQTIDGGDVEHLPSMLVAAGRNYDDILVIGDERELHRVAPEAASMLHVVRDAGISMAPSSHRSPGQLIAITREPWTLPRSGASGSGQGGR